MAHIWDKQNTISVEKNIIEKAIAFIQLLPLGIPEYSEGVEDDGDIVLDWYKSPTWTISISIGPNVITWAALYDELEAKGRFILKDEIPQFLIELIKMSDAPMHEDR